MNFVAAFKEANENILPFKRNCVYKLDGCIVSNAHNTVLGGEALLIYIVPVYYVKTGRYAKT